jgi:hypothetical protein
MEHKISELEQLVKEQIKEIKELKDFKKEQEKEIEDLKDFKTKIEVGSYWLRCAFYITGSIVVFAMAAYEFVIKHIRMN